MNSGKAGAVRTRFSALADADPLLVVPTADDVAAFQRELAADQPVVLGGQVTTFDGLFDEAARVLGVGGAPRLTAVQRDRALTVAVQRAPLDRLAAASARPGFVAELDRLAGELQGALVDGEQLTARAGELSDRHVATELAALLDAYQAILTELAREDPVRRARAVTAAARSNPTAWRRPVLLYGFDDLAPVQLSLVEALGAEAEITVALTWEDRRAFGARARTLQALRERGAEITETLPATSAHTASAVLHHLERRFEEEPESRVDPLDEAEGQGLELWEAGGEHAEMEQVAAEIARLLADPRDPVAAEDVAIVVRDPGPAAERWADTLAAQGIPAAVDGGIAFAHTAVGHATLAALATVAPGSPTAELIAALRGPSVARSGPVDRLESRLRREGIRDAAAGLELWTGPKDPIEWLAAAAEGPELLAACRRVVRALAERPHLREAAQPGPAGRREIRAAAAADAMLAELAEHPVLI
ncbi:MAG: hypothetical protein ACR2NA_05055, partial [Solirubrobacterales bacterium]